MSGDTEWRWADPSGQQRLVRTDELRAALASGVIAPNTPVWRQGWQEWRSATDVPELMSSALSSANGVFANIPPPPANVVAAQHAFEGQPGAKADPSQAEPPPPPSYVPTPARPQPGTFHTPSQPMRAPVSMGSGSSPAPRYAVSANTAVNIRALNEGDADALVFAKPAPHIIDLEPPTRRPDGEPLSDDREADMLKTLPNPVPSPAAPKVQSAPPPPPRTPPPPALTGIAALVGSPQPKPPPPPPPKSVNAPPMSVKPPPVSVKPPPPVSVKPPPPKPLSKGPPRPADVDKDVIEELSGSVLLTDQSTSLSVLEEVTGSLLVPDQSGSVTTVLGVDRAARGADAPSPRDKSGALLLPDLSGPAPAMAPTRAHEELSANFLLDAGSTGALPSVESTGRILAAKAASRAPFAPFSETGPAAPRLTPIAPVALPLGSIPSIDVPAAAPAAPPSVVIAEPEPKVPPPVRSEPFMVPQPPAAQEVPALRTLVGVPPPPDHILAEAARAHSPHMASPGPDLSGTVPPSLPPPERSTARLHDFRAMGHDPRAPYILAAFGVGGLLALVGMIGLVVSAFHKKGDDAVPATTTTATAAATSTARSAATGTPAATATAAPAIPAPPPGALGAACTLAGAAHVIAPRAIVQSGVETSVVGSRLAVGFAAREREGFAVAIDPSSAIGAQTVRARSLDAIRRVVPIEGPRGLLAAADTDRKSDFLGGRRTVPAQHPFDLGFGGGGLAWAPYRSSEVDLLWTLDGDDPVEAIRATPLDPAHEDTGWAIAFRRGSTIYAGAVSGGATFTSKGPLVKVAGLGPQVGSPTVAAQDGAVLVAWADRAQASEPWSLRWMRFAPGDATVDPKAFVPSEGGLGEHAMSPALAAAGQGRFVMSWTEGPVSTHQVRAQTISGSGAPLGNAMGISDSGVNAGQSQLAILPDGHGVVAYLASSGTGPKASYEVLATPIVCP